MGAFHGTAIDQHLDETDKITCPVSFHFGAEDPVVPMEQVEAIKKSYASHANAEIVVHPGATHNFSMPYKQGYHPEAAKASRDAVLRAHPWNCCMAQAELAAGAEAPLWKWA